MREIVRGLVAGSWSGLVAGLIAAALVLSEETYLTAGLHRLALEITVEWAWTAFALGLVVGVVAAVPSLFAATAERSWPAFALAFAGSLGAILWTVSGRTTWPVYRNEHSVLVIVLHALAVVAAAMLVASVATAFIRRKQLRPALALAPVALLLGLTVAFVIARPSPTGPSLLLVSVDTLRADRLGSYGHAAARTPVIDALAEAGASWDTVIAPSSVTLPATVTLMTGLDPQRHGVHYNGFYRLRREALTLAELLSDRGYATGAVVGNFALDSSFGLDQGFETYDDRMTHRMGPRDHGAEGKPVAKRAPGNWWSRLLNSRPAQRYADEITRAGIDWLDGRDPDEPFFLWVHYMDPHKPYSPPPEFLEGDPYDGEVAFVDAQIGVLLAHPSIDDDTLVVFVADHGESLGEHGYTGHVKVVYEQTIRVPLIMSDAPQRADLDRPLRGRDVLGLILRALGMEAPAAEDGEAEDWWAYAESYYPVINGNGSPLRTLRGERWKLVVAGAGRQELYDLQADPGELQDLAGEQPELVDRLRRILDERAGPAEDDRREVDDETYRKLKSLGYVD